MREPMGRERGDSHVVTVTARLFSWVGNMCKKNDNNLRVTAGASKGNGYSVHVTWGTLEITPCQR